jgi:pilus assembly protein CpaC
MLKGLRFRACAGAVASMAMHLAAHAQAPSPAMPAGSTSAGTAAAAAISPETVQRALASVQHAGAADPAASGVGTGNAQGSVFVPARPAATSGRASRRPVVIENGPHRSMVVGEVSTIELQSVARVAIGNGGIIKATVVDERQIVLIAEAAGDTTMRVWLKDGREINYELTVRAYRNDVLVQQLQALVADMPGVHAQLVGDKIVLNGRYPSKEAAAQVKTVLEAFPNVLNLIPEAPAEPEKIIINPTIQLHLRVIEVKKSALDQAGVNWATTALGPTFATNMLGYANSPWHPLDPNAVNITPAPPLVTTGHPIATFFGMATQLTSALNLLEQNGDAWTLAEPHLSCKSGGTSKFLAGGEIPIPVAEGFGAVSVVYKQYGVVIEFKPVSDKEGNVDSSISVEVSAPDPRNSNQGYVAFSTNRAETQIALHEGEPFVIAGLMQQSVDLSTNALPLLGRIPLLGSTLFGAKDNKHDKTELVVVVTPHLISASDEVNKRAVQDSSETSIDIGRRNGERLSENRPQ